MQATSIPAGFQRAPVGGGFVGQNGPLYARLHEGRLQLGFRVEERHTNPLHICHGGMLATFADMLLCFVILYEPGHERHFLPTISLQMDYLAQAELGTWVQGEGQVLRRTRGMVFAQGVITADERPALRASGIFKLGPLLADGHGADPLGLATR